LGHISQEKKTLVIYSYFEKNKQYIDNFRFFLEHGTKDSETDYFIVVNGETSVHYHTSNILSLKRKNEGFDFGAWTDALSLINTDKYDYFIFLNCTARGPFLPSWAEKQSWVKLFTDKINDQTKLVGPTISGHNGQPHVQSFLLTTDRVGLDVAKKAGIFNTKKCSKREAIDKEILFSTEILRAGYNIGCMLASYNGIDFRKNSWVCANSDYAGDPWYSNMYFGVNINPFEVLFFKANRNVTPEILEKYTNWMYLRK
tara:strand:+ start:132 stop:902 length:771 start_codon:yes stop_codon:yes gene_type:complete